MATVAMIMVLGFMIYIFRNYWRLMWKIKRYGTETEASVCRIEKTKRIAAGSATEYPMSFFYVAFQRQDGLTTEARLLNPKAFLTVGSQIRIKYLEEKNDCAVMTDIVEERASAA